MSQTITCRDCGRVVDVTGEMEFLNKLKDEGKIQDVRTPSRCKSCRDQNKKAGFSQPKGRFERPLDSY